MFSNSGIAANGAECLYTIEDILLGEPIKVFDASALKNSYGHVELLKLFGDTQEVLVGIEPDGHSYLMVGDVRYDGETFTAEGSIKTGAKTVRPGTLVRFLGLPPELVKSFRDRLAAEENSTLWSTSCYSGLCQKLKNSEIHLASGQTLLPTAIFRSIFKNGFVGAEGQPSQFEIYKVAAEPIQEAYKHLQRRQNLMFAQSSLIAVIFFGAIVHVFLHSEDDHSKLRKRR